MATLKILVTGAAGFIGFHLCKRLLNDGYQVMGLDNMNEYYDVKLKQDRLTQLLPYENFHFTQRDIADRAAIEHLFKSERYDIVIHLAAQAGVRYSLENPHIYSESNVTGFLNILEGCRHQKILHLIYASSSSVYGSNRQLPFSEQHSVDHPISLYAATKKANELMAHCYAHLYQIPCTGLRFFTVYGPWGRPDMALFKFTQRILRGEPIQIYNHGQMIRDFTYVDDIVEGMVRLLAHPSAPDPQSSDSNPATSSAPYRIYNIGNSQPVLLLEFIEVLERALGKSAIKQWESLQAGDVSATHADVHALEEAVSFHPRTSIEQGIGAFVQWYRSYYKI